MPSNRRRRRDLSSTRKSCNPIVQWKVCNILIGSSPEIIRDNRNEHTIFRERVSVTATRRIIFAILNCLVQTNEQHSQIVHLELHQRDLEVQQQNQRIHLKEVQIESLTKELHDLENCSLNAREELQQQRAQVGQSQVQLKLVTQKLHKLKMDEKPILNEIVHDEKQLGQVRANHLELQLHRKENLTRIQQYESNIAKLLIRVQRDDYRLAHESSALQHCNRQIRRSNETSHTLSQDLHSAELNHQYLKDMGMRLDEETIELKQNHGDLTFLVALIERRHGDHQRQLQVLYQKSKRQTQEHHQRGRHHTLYIVAVFPS